MTPIAPASKARRGALRPPRATVAALLAGLLAAASCGGRPPSPVYVGQGPGGTAGPSPGRGMSVEGGAPLTLELWPTVTGSQTGPLVDGARLASGDRIHLSANTSTAAHIYLLFCDSERKLTRYPRAGSVTSPGRQRAGVLGPDNLLLDDNPGREALYVIASQRPLDQADPRLDKALSGVRPNDPSGDCGERLETLLAGPPAHLKPLPAAPLAARPLARPAAKPPAPALDPEFERPSVECVRNDRPENAAACSAKAPKATLLRGLQVETTPQADVRATSNADGVVVLRFGFEHRPRATPGAGEL